MSGSLFHQHRDVCRGLVDDVLVWRNDARESYSSVKPITDEEPRLAL